MKDYTDEDIQRIKDIQDGKRYLMELKAARSRIMDGLERNGYRSGERAIWELIQNARDFSHKEPAIIRIKLTSEGLEFSHQAETFDQDTLTALIKQQSTKPGGEETVGRYGTGFMTTHAFSRRVFIKGDCRIEDQDGDSVYVTLPDGFCLDRRSDDEATFLHELDDELSTVNNLIDQVRNGHDSPMAWTTFFYPMDAEKAKTVSDQLETTIKLMPYVLVFNDNIAKCEVINEISGTKTHNVRYFKIGKDMTSMPYDESVKKCKSTIGAIENEVFHQLEIHSLLASDGKDRIVIPPLPSFCCDVDEIPSQFISFPMLGSENFGTNFIIHSERLHPTEPRNSFLLPQNNDGVIAKYNHNKKVLDEIIGVLFNYYDHNKDEQHLPIEFAKVAFNPGDYKDPVTQAYIQGLQDTFANKFIHWKMIPTDRGFLSIEHDASFVVLHPDMYSSLSEDALTKYIPALVSYAKKETTLPSKDVVEWSKVVSGWKPNRSNYYITLERVCNSISKKDDDLKSFLLLLKELGKTGTDLLAKYPLIPNREGALCKSGELVDASDITKDLYDISKPILGNKVNVYVNTDYADVCTLPKYDRSSLRGDLNSQIDELRRKTLKKTINYNTSPVSLNDAGLDTKLSDLVQFCSAFSKEGSTSFRARLLPYICRFYGLQYSPSVIPPISEGEVDFYSSAFNYLLDNTLYDLSKKPSSWLKDDENGVSMLPTLREFLGLYVQSNDKDYLRKLDEYGVFPSRNLDLCLPAELYTIESDPALDIILTLYKDLAAITKPIIKDYKDVLVHEDFSPFYQFKVCKASDITNQMESQLREKDADYSWESTRKVVLDIIEKIDKNKLPDENTFRDIRQKKPTIFFKNAVSGDKGKHVYTLMKQDDDVIEDLAVLTQEPDFAEMIFCAKTLLQQRRDEESDFQFKKAIGNHIEYLLRQRLGESVNNADFQFPDVQNGQDIVVFYKEKPIFFVEVKTKWNFTSSGPAFMTRNQVLKACNEKGRYALCCVDLTNYGLPDRTYPESIDSIMDRIKMKFKIGDDLALLMKPSFEASRIDPENNISIDGDFKARIPAGAFRKGEPFDALVSRIIDQAQKNGRE